MTITAKCTIEHGTIKLPPSLGLTDGMKVTVTIKPLLAKSSKKSQLLELAGSWSEDGSIDQIFTQICAERHAYYGRDVEIEP